MIDGILRTKLHDLTETLELCDESGHVLGLFTPKLDRSQFEGLEPQISNEELNRRKGESRRYTTAEVLAHLEKL